MESTPTLVTVNQDTLEATVKQKLMSAIQLLVPTEPHA